MIFSRVDNSVFSESHFKSCYKAWFITGQNETPEMFSFHDLTVNIYNASNQF